jgi:hypothetical protein
MWRLPKRRFRMELKTEIEKGLSQLQTLRDEIRVKLHLGGMDVKDEWNKLEPYVLDVEKKASDITEATREALDEALGKLKKLRSSLS